MCKRCKIFRFQRRCFYCQHIYSKTNQSTKNALRHIRRYTIGRETQAQKHESRAQRGGSTFLDTNASFSVIFSDQVSYFSYKYVCMGFICQVAISAMFLKTCSVLHRTLHFERYIVVQLMTIRCISQVAMLLDHLMRTLFYFQFLSPYQCLRHAKKIENSLRPRRFG